MLASVFVVLLVLSVENSLKKLQASREDFPGPKVSPFEPQPPGPLVCIRSEYYVLSFQDKAAARTGSPVIKRSVNLATKSLALSRYPIDTLDPPSQDKTGKLSFDTARTSVRAFNCGKDDISPPPLDLKRKTHIL